MSLRTDPISLFRLGGAIRADTRLSTTRQIVAVSIWLAAVVLMLALNRPVTDPDEMALLAVLLAGHTISILLSVRLSSGIFAMTATSSLVVVALVAGPVRALAISTLAFALAGLLFAPFNRVLRFPPAFLRVALMEGMFVNAGQSLGLFPAFWAYESIQALSLPVTPAIAYVGLALVYFAVGILRSFIWHWLDRTRALPVLLENWPILITNDLVAVFAVSEIAAHFRAGIPIDGLAVQNYAVLHLLLYIFNNLFVAFRRRLGDLAVLNRIGQALTANLNLEDLFVALRREIGRLADVSGFFLSLYDDQTGIISFPMNYQEGRELHLEPMPLQATMAPAHIIRTGQPLLVTRDLPEHIEGLGLHPVSRLPRSYLGVPVTAGDRVIGVMGLRDYQHENAFTASDQRLLQTIAAQAGVALENARLYRRSQAQASALSSLNRISMLSTSSLSPEELMHNVCYVVTTVMDYQKAAIFLTNEEGTHLRLAESIGLSTFFRDRSQEIALDEARVRHLASHRMIAVEDLLDASSLDDARWMVQTDGIRAVLDVPLIAGQQLIGSLAAYDSRPRRILPSEIELTQTLAGQIAVALENARLFQATRARNRELEVLYQTATALSASLSLRNVLRTIAVSLIEAVEAPGCSVWLALDDGLTLRAELRMVASVGAADERPFDPITLTLDELPTVARAARRAQPCMIGMVEAEVSEGERRLLAHSHTAAGLVLPLAMGTRPLGLIILDALDGHGGYSAGALRLATALANQAAIAISNAHRFEMADSALARRVDELSAIEQISRSMASRLDAQGVMDLVGYAAVSVTAADYVDVALLDEGANLLRSMARHEFRATYVERNWPADRGLTGRALRSGEVILAQDVSTEPGYHTAWEGVCSELVVPIILEGKRLGVINLESERPGAFTEEHVTFISSLAEHAAVAIANARLYEEQRRSHDRLQAILTSSTDGIMMFDPAGRLMLANPRADYLLNAHMRDYIGLPYSEMVRRFSRLPGKEGELPTLTAALGLARKIKDDPQAVTRRHYSMAGHAIEEVSTPVSGQDGQLLGRLLILRDVTAEMEQEALRDELSQMIVHDLRSPLTGVITGLHMVVDDLHKTPDEIDIETFRETLTVALNSSNNLLALIESMLDINKLESGEMPLNIQPVNLKTIARRAHQRLKPLATGAGIAVTISAPRGLPDIPADESIIERVFLNLLDNALRYTPEGGRVRIALESGRTYQRVSVIDSGEGIAPEARERVFERFSQTGGALRKRGPKGSGLGLTFCRLAVEAHRGRIWIDEGPGGGTAVRFTLPTAISS